MTMINSGHDRSHTHVASSFAVATWYINSMPVQKAANESTRSNADDVASMQHVFLHGTVTAHVHCNACLVQLRSSLRLQYCSHTLCIQYAVYKTI